MVFILKDDEEKVNLHRGFAKYDFATEKMALCYSSPLCEVTVFQDIENGYSINKSMGVLIPTKDFISKFYPYYIN